MSVPSGVTSGEAEKGDQVLSDDSEGHEMLTPQTGIENFFMGGLPTQNISASALAQEIHLRHHSPRRSWGTPCASPSTTFETPRSTTDDSSEHFAFSDTTATANKKESPFAKDALLYPRDFSETTTTSEPEKTPYQPRLAPRTMAAATTPATTTAPTVAAIPDAPAPLEEPMHVDPAEKIYDTVKGVWGWGKGIVVFSPFLGLAEGLAGKVVETAGSSLEDVDNAVTGKLQGLDDGILNPAIQVVVKTVVGAASKTEAFVKPIVMTLLKPIDFMIKNKPDNNDTTTTTEVPEITPDVEPMN